MAWIDPNGTATSDSPIPDFNIVVKVVLGVAVAGQADVAGNDSIRRDEFALVGFDVVPVVEFAKGLGVGFASTTRLSLSTGSISLAITPTIVACRIAPGSRTLRFLLGKWSHLP